MAVTILSGGLNNRTGALVKGGSAAISLNPALINDRIASKMTQNLVDVDFAVPNDVQKCVDVDRGSKMVDDINQSPVAVKANAYVLGTNESMRLGSADTGYADCYGRFYNNSNSAFEKNYSVVTSSVGTDNAAKNPTAYMLNGKRVITGN